MCKLCETKPVYEFTNKRKVCERCYINWFQKKFLYTIRKFELIKKGETIGIEHNDNFRTIALENLMKILTENGTIKVIKISKTKRQKIDKIATPSTTDTEADKIIHEIVKGNIENLKELSPKDSETIKPLYLFLDKEVLLYAKIKKLNFKEKKENKNSLESFMDILKEKHPEIKHSIIKSYLKLK